MKQDLSRFERKFIEGYIETGIISEAAKRAGSKGKDSASLYVVGKRVLDRVGLTLQEIQEMNGITDQHLTVKLNEGLSADKCYFGTWQGGIVQSASMPDVPTRLKALEIAHRLRGQFIDKHELTGKDGGDITLVYKPASKNKSKKVLTFDD